ncbi:MAG: response regulator, partial [Candidatus Latescibacterota bacterium]
MRQGKPIAILMVEDDDGHALLVEEALREGGVTNDIYRVRDGQEALDFLYRRGTYEGKDVPRPGLILLDIQLPKMDGYEVLKKLKSDGQLKNIPVIMLTMTSDQREIDRCYELGANSYIVKPVDFDAFMDKIKKLGLFIQIISYP